MGRLEDLLVSELEEIEFDIHSAEDMEKIGQFREQAESILRGAKASTVFDGAKLAEWEGRVRQVVEYRTAALGEVDGRDG